MEAIPDRPWVGVEVPDSPPRVGVGMEYIAMPPYHTPPLPLSSTIQLKSHPQCAIISLEGVSCRKIPFQRTKAQNLSWKNKNCLNFLGNKTFFQSTKIRERNNNWKKKQPHTQLIIFRPLMWASIHRFRDNMRLIAPLSTEGRWLQARCQKEPDSWNIFMRFKF